MKWLAENHTRRAAGLLAYIPVYGRYDDWFYLLDTPLRTNIAQLTRSQLTFDMLSQKNAVSLLAKWCPSENASSPITKRRAKTLIKLLGISAKQYRQMLSKLRTKINVLEKLMSANEWDKIEFDKIPSKAGLKYKNAFARRDIIAKKYEAFAKDKKTKVNAGTLYPYEVVEKAISCFYKYYRYRDNNINETDRAMINKYWENLPDYLEGKDCSIMCVIDTSASMWGTPIHVAISLGLYCAERIGGDFRNHYISFSRHPRLIKTEGVDFVDKVERIYKTNLCENTNLIGVFDLLLNNALKPNVNINDIPKTIVVISDMEIDQGTGFSWSRSKITTEMEQIREKWARHGLELPKLVYWNVDARQNNILDAGPNVSFVSGFSPIIFKQVITGKTGYDLMLEALLNERYEIIK